MPRAATSLKAFKAKSALTKRQQDDSRYKMMQRVSQISTRLANFAEATPDDPDFERKQMTMAQLKAADMLLARTVPVLSAVQIISDEDTEGLTRDEIEARIKEKITNNPMLGVLAGLTPNTIEGEAIDISEDTERDE